MTINKKLKMQCKQYFTKPTVISVPCDVLDHAVDVSIIKAFNE